MAISPLKSCQLLIRCVVSLEFEEQIASGHFSLEIPSISYVLSRRNSEELREPRANWARHWCHQKGTKRKTEPLRVCLPLQHAGEMLQLQAAHRDENWSPHFCLSPCVLPSVQIRHSDLASLRQAAPYISLSTRRCAVEVTPNSGCPSGSGDRFEDEPGAEMVSQSWLPPCSHPDSLYIKGLSVCKAPGHPTHFLTSCHPELSSWL